MMLPDQRQIQNRERLRHTTRLDALPFRECAFEIEVALEGRRVFEAMPRAVPLELARVVVAPRAEREVISADPAYKIGKYDIEGVSRIHVLLANGGQFGAEIAQYGTRDRPNKPVILTRWLGGCGKQFYRANFDGFHPFGRGSGIPASRFQIDNHVTHGCRAGYPPSPNPFPHK